MNRTFYFLAVFLLILPGYGCDKNSPVPSDENVSVPSGDPSFPPLEQFWVIDKAGVMHPQNIEEASTLCQELKDQGLAEVVVLIQNGVQHPADYATHFGRWLRLGKKGLGTEGGNNGIVWLIRPDATEKITYSVGRGLPLLTSGRMVDIINASKDYFNFNNYDQGVLVLLKQTQNQLVQIYGRKGVSP